MANQRRGGGRGFRPRRGRRKVCLFCAEKDQKIDYKDVPGLKCFLAESGKILPRRMSGLCTQHQRELAINVKRARQLALIPYTED
ncbi:MAG: 30S ribosomal protein S18 [Eubacteriales bacterium]|nr:30S ribosomal protein S18 [Eubacteriales bacterium]